jgi:hypothetical protein
VAILGVLLKKFRSSILLILPTARHCEYGVRIFSRHVTHHISGIPSTVSEVEKGDKQTHKYSLIDQLFLLYRKQSKLKVYGSSKDLTKKKKTVQVEEVREQGPSKSHCYCAYHNLWTIAAHLFSCRNIPFRQSLTCPQPGYINSHIEMLFFITSGIIYKRQTVTTPLFYRYLFPHDIQHSRTVHYTKLSPRQWLICLLIDILFLKLTLE